jgi:hypothetical protein
MCKHGGELTESVGSKICIINDSTGLDTVEFMQTVLMHKLLEEYKTLH